MSRLLPLLIACLVFLGFFIGVRAAAAQEGATIEVFVREGCPRCAAAEKYLSDLQTTRPKLHVVYRSIDRDPAALADFARVTRAAGVEAPGVPAFVVGKGLLIGFHSPEVTGPELDSLLANAKVWPAPTSGTCPTDSVLDCDPAPPSNEVSTAFGNVSLSRLGLPLFTIVLGLLDGFNPCAMWVLLFLISMLVNFRSRRRMALVAGTFVATSGIVYFAFMAAWLNVFLLIGLSRAVQLVLALVAFGIGALNTKDFFAFKRGASLSIPESAKPGIYARVRSILRARTLSASLAGVATLAVLVNFVELLCTAGLPAIYTAVLAHQELPWFGHYGYLALYNLAYVFDDSLMVSLAVFTLSRRKLTERAGRWLKLVSGVVMLALAGALLFAPDVLI
ncbi:MAG TPA: NrdH-redoxin [Polyangiaceae bacterium]